MSILFPLIISLSVVFLVSTKLFLFANDMGFIWRNKVSDSVRIANVGK